MAWTGYYGGFIGDMLFQWEQAGVFSYLLPFLLIFALVFAILTRLNIFKGKTNAINGVIALVVGLMALQFEIVPFFFAELFPKVGIALSIILALLIVGGLFLDPENRAWMNGLMIVAVFIVGIIVVQSLGVFGFTTGYWIQAYWAEIIGIGLFVGILVAIIMSAKDRKDKPSVGSVLAKTLRQ
ncbi:hypothetical protein ACFLZJ_00055 [Nanoarchaeota archaeon]